jgi:hypothetical protein
MLLLMVGLLTACETGVGDERPAALYFTDSTTGLYPLSDAWNAALADPTVGLDYGFPVTSVGVPEDAIVRLYVGYSSMLHTADDVILLEELLLDTTVMEADGTAHFSPLDVVVEGGVSSDTAALPAQYLCGETVFAARAFLASDDEPPAFEFLAATSIIFASEPCQHR